MAVRVEPGEELQLLARGRRAPDPNHDLVDIPLPCPLLALRRPELIDVNA
jgi:hypothetical protein